MPSDCQCSACGACESTVIEKRIGNKEAIKMIEKLEAKIKLLEKENKILLEKNKRVKISKEEIVAELLKQLKEL
jgi:carbonic anhydrase